MVVDRSGWLVSVEASEGEETHLVLSIAGAFFFNSFT